MSLGPHLHAHEPKQGNQEPNKGRLGHRLPPLALKSSDLYRVRALEIVKRKVLQNQTHKQIASEMGIHPDTVERSLVWARKANIFKKLEDQMWQEMVPKAMKRVLRELDNEDGDVKTAEKVLYSIGLWKKAASRQESQAEQDDQETLAAWVTAARVHDEHQALEAANTFDGELIAGTDDLEHLAGLLPGADITGDEPELPPAGGTESHDHPPAVAAPHQEPREG